MRPAVGGAIAPILSDLSVNQQVRQKKVGLVVSHVSGDKPREVAIYIHRPAVSLRENISERPAIYNSRFRLRGGCGLLGPSTLIGANQITNPHHVPVRAAGHDAPRLDVGNRQR